MDPAKMKVVDLRSELGALGLDTKGNKPALVERLKKALESKTGKAIADTTILDTSTEDADEPSTPRKPGPAARTRRRSSSSRLAVSTPSKVREEPPEPIIEEPKEEPSSSPEPQPSPPRQVLPPQPVPAPPTPMVQPPVKEAERPHDDEVYCVEDDKSQSPILVRDDKEETEMEVDQVQNLEADSNESSNDNEEKPIKEKERKSTETDRRDSGGRKSDVGRRDSEGKKTDDAGKKADDAGKKADDAGKKADDVSKKDDEEITKEKVKRELTEEEEWDLLNERLKVREKERLEREKIQREEDAKRLAELSDDPVRLNRLKRKHEKKARWSNFYRSVEVTNEVLTPPTEQNEKVLPKDKDKNKKETVEVKMQEPEINEHNITLSWYDSDLNQYLEVPELNAVVPLSDGAFFHAWAGARATHGVTRGRVCYELRVGSVVTTTETAEKDAISSGLRIGWSTEDSSLHLGEGELSWGYESTGRAVHNAEFKEYGKQLTEKDVVGVYLDLESSPCKMSYTVNGLQQGTAFEFDRSELQGKALFPHVLTKNMCYKVNFGYDRYNMLTKTKIVRKRIEIPVEQVLEEKRIREEQIQKQKEEAQRKEKERREKEKKEREERQRKKREERERIEREKKEKEAQEKRDRGEEVVEEDAAEKEKEKEKEREKEMEVEIQSELALLRSETQPQENGEKAADSQVEVEVKVEPMETDQGTKDVEVKAPEVKTEAPATGAVPEVTEEQVLKGVALDKRIKFVYRYTVEEELDGHEACLEPGYTLICHADLEDGPSMPATLAECEVILMVGMPGSGKTHWARQHAAAHPEKRYNLLSTGSLFDKMKVDCKPFRTSYEGRWDAMVTKCAKCVLKLLENARGRRRNYILDQTNVYASAQRRKLREFDGYRRMAVVIVTDEETYRERQKRREEADGKEVPDGAIVDMKANFSLPEKGSWLDEVVFPELNEEESKKIVEGFHKEAKAAGVVREKERRERSESRDAPPHKRPRSDDRKRRDDRRSRDFSRGEREDRWGGGGGGGGGGGSRWGPATGRGGGAPGGGGRWGGAGGGRDRGPPPGRFDRWGGGGGRNDFGGGGRDRDGFRGGRGGPGGPGGPPGGRDRGPGGPGGPGGPRGPPGGNSRFDRSSERNNRGPGGPGGPGGLGGPGGPGGPDKRPGGAGQGGGGAGTWQRGGQPVQNNRGAMQSRPGPGQVGPRPNKDGPNQNQQNQQQGWNQWAGGWGGWGNWNQNQAGWGNWGNWGNWANPQAAAAAAGGAGAQAAGKAGAQAGQQQQQYQQGNQQAPTAADAQAWAQYYQNYGGANTAAAGAATQGAVDKK